MFDYADGRVIDTGRLTLDFGAIQCVDRIEIYARSEWGAATMFLIGGEAGQEDPLIQDEHMGTITLPARDPFYTFRVDRHTSQVSFLVAGGGGARVYRACGIVTSSCNWDR